MKLFRSLLPVYLAVMALFWGATVFGSHAVTAMAENRPVSRRTVFVIDAGHGGMDGGTVSCTGVEESQINLEIAKRIAACLQLLGCEAKMTRETADDLSTQGETIAARKLSDLKNRVRLVNETEGAVLVSIHQNRFPSPRYKGAQVFYARTAHSRELAQQLQTALRTSLDPENHRKIKQAEGVYLLQHIQKPAVLIECGFLSNPWEEERLRSPVYQKQLSSVVAAALASART